MRLLKVFDVESYPIVGLSAEQIPLYHEPLRLDIEMKRFS